MSEPATLSEIDAQLRFAAILPDFQSCLDQMAGESSPVAAGLALKASAYGEDPRQWVETAKGTGTAPIVPVFVHGGYWRALRAEDHRFVLPGLSGLGVGVANLEYRLMPDVRMAEVVADVHAGLHHVRAAYPEASLLVIGHSAGAHLGACALGMDERLSRAATGFVSLSGIFDLGVVAQSFLQAELRLTEREIERFSIQRAPNDVRALFVAGSKETALYKTACLAMSESVSSASSLLLSPCHHMNILQSAFLGAAPLMEVLRDWIAGSSVPRKLEVSIP